MDDEDNKLIEAMLASGELTNLEADKLEIALRSQPSDLGSRITLISYYNQKGTAFDSKRVQHILWIVANHPDLCKYVTPGLAVSSDSDFYDQAKSAWLEQIKNHPSKVSVLKNAAMVFRGEDDFVRKLLEDASAIAPNDLDVQNDLANHYRRKALLCDGEEAKANSTIAWKKFEDILSQCTDETERFYQLDEVATTAFGAGELQRADEIAQELLRVAPNFENDWNYGNAVFWANIVLGKIAFSKGDIEGACAYLIAASETPGSPQLDSFGPEFVLCSQLLTVGKGDFVERYLQNCSKFWEMDDGKLSQWIRDIHRGITPSFSKNC